MPRLFSLLGPLVLAGSLAQPVAAQWPSVPFRDWRTIATPHFRVHYQTVHEAFARDVAEHIEGVREAVTQVVGYVPPQTIDIIVEDPSNVSNGSAFPSLAYPSMRFWPTPMDPSNGLGHNRGWAEILSVHEYTHLVHLLRPSRNRSLSRYWQFSPVPIGPLTVAAPAWVIEGYATVIEGQLTGSGRPNGTARPALLRQLALEGALPSYGALDATGSFQGGSMRYLVGSAYLEWLAARRGDSSLVHLWRRMSARADRSFADAFTGVFGEGPATLYGQFTAELTAKAVEGRERLQANGLAVGTRVQRFAYYVGAPAVSPDGQLVAIRRSVPGALSRIDIVQTVPEPEDSLAVARARAALAKDPEDVAAYTPFPRAPKRVASLRTDNGVGFSEPRFFADGDRLLVTRPEPLPDGRLRPDLWIWHYKSGWKQRITVGAAIRSADPLPNGALAAGLRCLSGACDVVLIDLVTGGVRPLAVGTVQTTYAGVRVSPDGSRIATARQRDGIWRVATIDIATGAVTEVGPADGQPRHSPTWTPDGTGLMVVSEASGTANLERLDLASGATSPVTRTTGAVSFPEVARDGRAWFLDLHARGYDLRVMSMDSAARSADTVALREDLAPAAPRMPPTTAVRFATGAATATTYGIGPLGVRPMLFSSTAADGSGYGIAANLTDPVGRLGVVLQAGVGTQGTWRGTSLSAVWRGWRPEVTADLWGARHDPSRQRAAVLGPTVDVDSRGAALGLRLHRASSIGRYDYRVVASTGDLMPRGPSAFTRTARTLAVTDVKGDYEVTPKGIMRVMPAFHVQGATGRSFATGWQRVLVEGSVALTSVAGDGLRFSGAYGATTASAPVYERFVVGGSASPYVNDVLLGQRVVSPGLPFGVASGSRLARLRVDVPGLVSPFYEWYAVGESLNQWQRITGIEIAGMLPPLPALRVPGIRGAAGMTYSVDAPWRQRTRAYVGFTLTP